MLVAADPIAALARVSGWLVYSILPYIELNTLHQLGQAWPISRPLLPN